MRHIYANGSGSVAAIFGHPLHPMIVPLPIGAFVIALGFDIAFLSTGDPFWARAAFILIGVGLATGALAGLLGIVEMMSLRRARTMGLAWAHGGANILALFVSGANFLLRWEDPAAVVALTGVALSAVAVALLGVGGWIGGEMSYKHGIGVSEDVGADSPHPDPDRLPDGRSDIGHS